MISGAMIALVLSLIASTTLPSLPVAPWSGRLILPTPAERMDDGSVFVVVENAPPADRDLVGQRVRVRYGDDAALLERAARATVDVHFTSEVRAAMAKGVVHPARLDGWTRVSPLESLAGVRPTDDVQVVLRRVRRDGDALVVAVEPMQSVGTEVFLATFVAPAGPFAWKVRAWDRAARAFRASEDLVVVPPETPSPTTRAPWTSLKGIHATPQNAQGWYVYGKRDPAGRFVVEALEPRALFRLAPDLVFAGQDDAKRYLKERNWSTTEAKKQQSWTALLAAAPGTKEALVARWQKGDRALVVHVFGGVSGPKGEPLSVPLTVAGHFSFGQATVEEDPFTGDLRLVVEYQQVYAHTMQGIASGSTTWALYMGSLARGWMYQRPLSDLLVRLPALTSPYTFPSGRWSALEAFAGELEVMSARYRTGDGTGGAFVTPSTSCVQDSAQSLFVSLARFAGEVKPRAEHADAPTMRRFAQLTTILRDVEQDLVPLGFLRADWQQSARLASVVRAQSPTGVEDAARAAVTAPTMLPRSAHDLLGLLAIDHGADVWVLRTNQIGGTIDGIEPQAPQSILRR